MWPTVAQFEADGFGQLRAAIVQAGGVERWAPAFALPIEHHLRGGTGYWTEQRLEAELRRLAAGHEIFPSCAEFRTAGRGGLLSALRRHGGLDAWAARLGLPRRERYSGRVGTAM